jgi:hypothetical protein
MTVVLAGVDRSHERVARRQNSDGCSCKALRTPLQRCRPTLRAPLGAGAVRCPSRLCSFVAALRFAAFTYVTLDHFNLFFPDYQQQG